MHSVNSKAPIRIKTNLICWAKESAIGIRIRKKMAEIQLGLLRVSGTATLLCGSRDTGSSKEPTRFRCDISSLGVSSQRVDGCSMILPSLENLWFCRQFYGLPVLLSRSVHSTCLVDTRLMLFCWHGVNPLSAGRSCRGYHLSPVFS